MVKLRMIILLCAILGTASACASQPVPQASLTALPIESPSGGTQAAPTPPPGATQIPWFDAVIAKLDLEPGEIGKPTDLVVMGDGTIFVADIKYHRILHLDTQGKVLNQWGQFAAADQGQQAPTGTFNEPWGLGTSANGLLYVADTWNHRVQVFQLDGTFAKTWGEFGQGTDPYLLYGPRDIAVDENGFVFVSDTGNKRIVVYDQEGQYISQIGGEGSEPGQFNEPVGITIGSDGDLIVADQWNHRIQIFTVNGDGTLEPKISWQVDAWKSDDLLYKPYLCVLNNHVFLTDTEAGLVREYTTSGELLFTYDLNSTGYLNYGLLYGIAADLEGGLWVSDLAGGAGVLVKIVPQR